MFLSDEWASNDRRLNLVSVNAKPGIKMKLMRHTPTNVEGDETHFTISEEMASDDLHKLKSKGNELCHIMATKPSAWTSKYPIMGNNTTTSNTGWVMILDNGTVFSIEK